MNGAAAAAVVDAPHAGEPERPAKHAPRIGSRIRTARRRHGLELADVERDLRIRARYLEALEAERFDELPGEAYARAFLREYAAYLGLDADLVVQAVRERLDDQAELDEAEPVPPERRSIWVVADRLAGRVRLPGALLVVALGIAVLAVAWAIETGGPETSSTPRFGGAGVGGGAPSITRIRQVAVPRHAKAPVGRASPPKLARLVLSPAAGPCWLLVRAGGESGPMLYEGTLQPGSTIRFARRRLWVRMGAPWNLTVRLNGRGVSGLPTRPANVVVTPTALRPV